MTSTRQFNSPRQNSRTKNFAFKEILGGATLALIVGIFGYFGYLNISNITMPSSSSDGLEVPYVAFVNCGSGKRINCVVDGDTFYLDGFSIRVADIDTPETNGARCEYEADLGAQATLRFKQLLNAGPFEVRSIPKRDTDQYGRKLRTVHRDGISLGQMLVDEGLARVWDGRRHPWC